MEKIKNFLIEYGFANSEKTLIVGFSGGWDSMCLLHNLVCYRDEFGFKLVAAHLNHNWRVEAVLEQEKCQKFCEKYDVEFYTETLPEGVKKTETVARELRYEFFANAIKKYSADALFTAHNADDNAETLIYRIVKGTGIRGLAGISKFRDEDKIFRPLLEVRRNEIEDYCRAKGLSPNCDSSNDNTKYKRNLIRHEILPKMKEINKDAVSAINSLSRLADDEYKMIEEFLQCVRENVYENDRIVTEKFKTLSQTVKRRLIYELFIALDIDYDYEKIDRVVKFIDNNKNSKIAIAKGLWLAVNQKYILPVKENEKDMFEIEVRECGKYEIPNSQYRFCIEKWGKSVNEFPPDKDLRAFVKLKDINFTLRHRRDGDFIYPLGLKGKEKLKKYLSEKKLFKFEKDDLILLTQGSEVLWVASLGISEKIKVEKSATHVIYLEKR